MLLLKKAWLVDDSYCCCVNADGETGDMKPGEAIGEVGDGNGGGVKLGGGGE